jgi:hypothetical protein
MNTGTSSEMPLRVSLALRTFWVVLAVSVVLGMWVELGPAIANLRLKDPSSNLSARLLLALAIAVFILLLTPKFIGSVIAAIMLVLAARRIVWSRWVLLLSLLATAVVLALETHSALSSEPPRQHLVVALIELLLLAVLAIATAQLFSSEATAWFKAR